MNKWIVIGIIAFLLVLGGIGGFVKKSYSPKDDRHVAPVSKIEQLIIDDIKQSGELFTFDKLEITAEMGKESVGFFGIKNTALDEQCFQFQIKCLESIRGTVPEICGPEAIDRVVGGYGVEGKQKWFSMFSELPIDGNEIIVLPFEFQVGRMEPDTFILIFEIYQRGTADCESPVDDSVLYETEEFFVVLE